MSQEDAAKLIEAMPEHLRPVLVVTVLAHLRLGELLALRRGDVDLAAGTIHIQRSVARTKGGPVEKTTKTGNARLIHLPPEALEALRDHLMTTGPGLPTARLFTHPTGAPLAAHHIRVPWKRAREKTGLTKFHFHDLRHAGLTWVTQNGASLKEVMNRGGHRTVHAALIYQHAAEMRDAQLARSLAIKPREAGSGGS